MEQPIFKDKLSLPACLWLLRCRVIVIELQNTTLEKKGCCLSLLLLPYAGLLNAAAIPGNNLPRSPQKQTTLTQHTTLVQYVREYELCKGNLSSCWTTSAQGCLLFIVGGKEREDGDFE